MDIYRRPIEGTEVDPIDIGGDKDRGTFLYEQRLYNKYTTGNWEGFTKPSEAVVQMLWDFEDYIGVARGPYKVCVQKTKWYQLTDANG